MNYKQKLLALIIFCAIIVIALPFYIHIGWEALIIIPLFCYLTKGLGSEVGAHRMWAHRSFNTSVTMQRILLILDTLAIEGIIISFAGVHRLHHANSDSTTDPHNPNLGILKAIFYQHEVGNFKIGVVKDLFSNPWVVFQHKHYFKIQIIIMLLLSAISPMIFWYYCVNAFATIWINFLVNVVCHTWGSNAHHLQNNSKNNKWADIFLLGVGQHNTHHKNPGQIKLCRYDVWGYFINLIKIS